MRRTLPAALLLALTPGVSLAQPAPAPAQVGITPTMPETLQVLDSTQTWVPFGTVDPQAHTFTYGGAFAGSLSSATGLPISTGLSGCSPNSVVVGLGATTLACQTTLPPSLAFVGAVSGSMTTDGAVVTDLNSAKTAYNIYSTVVPGNWFFYDTHRSVLDLEPGSTVQTASAYNAYIYDNVPKGVAPNEKNASGYTTVEVAATSNAALWGFNPGLSDSVNNQPHGNTGIKLIGGEIDFTVSETTGTIVSGMTLSLQGTGTPVASGYQTSTLNGLHFNYSFTSNDAAATNALYAGASAVAGASVPSQVIKMAYYDSGSTIHAVNLTALNGLDIGITGFANGFALNPSNANAPVALSAIGAGTGGMTVSGGAGFVSFVDGRVNLTNATQNFFNFGTNLGSGAPAFTTRSVGTKIVLNDAESGSSVDYGVGVATSAVWFSLSTSTSSKEFDWYGGITKVASLTGVGRFTALEDIIVGAGGVAPTLSANQGALYSTAALGGVVSGSGSTADVTLANKSGAAALEILTGTTTVNLPAVTTGTPVASLCLDASGNIVKKTTAGSCI